MKLKRILAVVLCAVLMLTVMGCGQKDPMANLQKLEDIARQQSAAAAENETPVQSGTVTPESSQVQSAGTEASQQAQPDPSGSSTDGVDIDLTKLSATMVYSEVFNMMNYPENYVGKIIKAKGAFSEYNDEGTGNTYYAVVVADATACCSQGLEFVWLGEHSEEDYPDPYSEITVTGEFQIYDEYGYTYIQLQCDKVEF